MVFVTTFPPPVRSDALRGRQWPRGRPCGSRGQPCGHGEDEGGKIKRGPNGTSGGGGGHSGERGDFEGGAPVRGGGGLRGGHTGEGDLFLLQFIIK